MNNSNRKYNMGSIKMELIQKMEFAGLYVGGIKISSNTPQECWLTVLLLDSS